jgi:putative ABC transport system permease protein
MTRKIIFSYLRKEPLAFSLAVLLCALGMTAAICVLWLQTTLFNHATAQAKDIDLIVGAKGSALQNTLAGVYHLDVPNGNIRLSEVEQLAKHPMVARVIPISLGDSVNGARIVGAGAEFFELYGAQLSVGALPASAMQASVGASAAERLKLAIGDHFVGGHGLAEGGDTHDEHVYTVVGILAPTGRVIDQLVITPLESVWVAHASHTASTEPEVTFALLQTRGPVAMASLPRFINSQTNMQAASPAAESARLLANFGWVALIIQAFAVALIAASMLALLAAIVQSLERHKTDVALLRAMGVTRLSIQKVLLGESLLVILLAAIAALLISIACMLWLSTVALPGIVINPIDGLAYIASVVGVALLLGVIATIPAIRRAFRFDIATQLSHR